MRNSQLSKYEGQLKGAIQATQVQFLNSEETFIGKNIQELLDNENRLFRYLELEVQRLNPASREEYQGKLKKYKAKIREHEEYFKCKFESKLRNFDIHQDDEDFALNQIAKARNEKLMQDRLVMEENKLMTDNIRNEVLIQGNKIRQGMEVNRGIQVETEEAESSIALIQRAITKRKIMFSSLCVLLLLAVVGVIVIKLRRITK